MLFLKRTYRVRFNEISKYAMVYYIALETRYNRKTMIILIFLYVTCVYTTVVQFRACVRQCGRICRSSYNRSRIIIGFIDKTKTVCSKSSLESVKIVCSRHLRANHTRERKKSQGENDRLHHDLLQIHHQR